MSAPHISSGAEVRPFPTKAPASEPAGEAPNRHEMGEAVRPAAPKKRSSRGFVLPVLLAATLAGAGWYGYHWWTDGRFMVSTDDAYIVGKITSIAPKIGGYVASVEVTENQAVKAGDPIFTIDDGDYRIALQQAEAQIATQQKSLDRINAQIEAAKAALQQAQAAKSATQAVTDNAATTLDRANQLHTTKFASQSQLDAATAALKQAQANLEGADAKIAAASADIAVLKAQYNEAESGIASLDLVRDKAARDLSFTTIRAPYDGVIGNLSVEKGAFVSTGQRLAALVPVHNLYIEANFKETQIARIASGEKVRITIDAMDDEPFEGTVTSLAPASGSVFSLLPAENATGNFTKVVQRVPVRIDFPEELLASGKLRAGLSTIVEVDTRTAPISHGTLASTD
ncbi:MAG: HlyD family secretion protein [Phyllobacterium sp.]